MGEVQRKQVSGISKRGRTFCETRLHLLIEGNARDLGMWWVALMGVSKWGDDVRLSRDLKELLSEHDEPMEEGHWLC
jgi:hypothetical protein